MYHFSKTALVEGFLDNYDLTVMVCDFKRENPGNSELEVTILKLISEVTFLVAHIII